MKISVTTDIENDLITDFDVIDTIVKDGITCYIGQDTKGSVLVKDNYTVIYRKNGENTKTIGQFGKVWEVKRFITDDLDLNMTSQELELVGFKASMDSVCRMLDREYKGR